MGSSDFITKLPMPHNPQVWFETSKTNTINKPWLAFDPDVLTLITDVSPPNGIFKEASYDIR